MQARNTYDLIDGGSEIPVTGANVSQFVHLYVQHVLYIFSAKALTVCLYAYLYFSTPTNACHVCVYVCGGKREREKLCGCRCEYGCGCWCGCGPVFVCGHSCCQTCTRMTIERVVLAMHHVTHRGVRMSHATRMNESCHTYE